MSADDHLDCLGLRFMPADELAERVAKHQEEAAALDMAAEEAMAEAEQQAVHEAMRTAETFNPRRPPATRARRAVNNGTPELVTRLLADNEKLHADKERMRRLVLQREMRSSTLTRQLIGSWQKVAKGAAEQAATKKRADANETHLRRISDAHTLLRKSEGRMRACESKLQSLTVAHRDALEQIAASREESAALRAMLTSAEAKSQAACESLRAERARREILDERLGFAHRDASTLQRTHSEARAQSEVVQRQSSLLLSQTALEREALRGQLEVTSSKLADALRRLEEERAQRQRGEDKAEAEAAAMHAECGAVKATAQEASLKWDYAVREVGAARAELLAVRAELSDCKQRLEAAETTKAAWKSQWAAREAEAAGEMERLEAERRSLIVSESDAHAQNVRLQIELRAMRHSGWDQGGPPLQELRAASMAASSSADAGPLGSYATPVPWRRHTHTLKLDKLSGSSVSPPTKDLHAS